MMRRWIFVVLLTLMAATFGVAANGGFEVRGQLTANETEAQEGYFAIAEDTVLMVRPGSELHRWLKAHAGRSVRVVVEPAPTE